jgi:hypothetical protein
MPALNRPSSVVASNMTFYSRTKSAEIQAEMGSSKRQGEAKQAPQQDHTEAGRANENLAGAALNECGHGFRSPSSTAAHFFQASPAIFPIEQVKDC